MYLLYFDFEPVLFKAERAPLYYIKEISPENETETFATTTTVV